MHLLLIFFGLQPSACKLPDNLEYFLLKKKKNRNKNYKLSFISALYQRSVCGILFNCICEIHMLHRPFPSVSVCGFFCFIWSTGKRREVCLADSAPKGQEQRRCSDVLLRFLLTWQHVAATLCNATSGSSIIYYLFPQN